MNQIRPQLSLLVLSGALSVVALLVALHTRTSHSRVPVDNYLMERTLGGVFILALRGLLAVRRPEHPVTWLFVAIALLGHRPGTAQKWLTKPATTPNRVARLIASSVARPAFRIILIPP